MFNGDLKFQHPSQDRFCSAQVELYREFEQGFELERVGTVLVREGGVELVTESLFSVSQFLHILKEAAAFFRKQYPGSLPARPTLRLLQGGVQTPIQLALT